MPKPMQYKVGSVIYFKGDLPSDRVFLLHNGKAQLTYNDIETGVDVHDSVAPGEFFGVKSALGKYQREESAIAVQDTTVMVFSVSEFEAVAMANIRIVMKMLKVFSNQLRRIHKQVSSLMATDEQSQEAGLFSIGEYYLKNRRFAQAKYVFDRYLTYYPAGRDAAQAAKNLAAADTNLARYGSRTTTTVKQNIVRPVSKPVPDSSAEQAAPKQESPAQDSAQATASTQSDTAKLYYDAVSLVSQKKLPRAFAEFKKIVDANEEPEFVAKSSFEIGKCFFAMDLFDDCIKYYTQMIKNYPKHPQLEEALFFMGQCYERNEQREKAISFYKMVLTKINNEDNSTYIKAKKALKAMEG
ncbi:cyclic nucleotide-binding domain-containing protein [Breznakiellaceae bacterium SP9]